LVSNQYYLSAGAVCISFHVVALEREILSDFNERVIDRFGNDRFILYPLLLMISTIYLLFTLLYQVAYLIEGLSYYKTGLKKDPLKLYFAVFSTAIAFGAIHCIPWSFEFPTHQEQIVWRVCALLVTTLPITFILLIDRIRNPILNLPYLLRLFCALFVFGSPVLYIAARVTLITLALMDLRALPQSAHQVIQWTSLLPHI